MRGKWTVVASLAVIGFVIGGSGAVAIGLLITPMMTEFAWSNALTSGMVTAFNLAGLLAAPGVGIAVDRFGAKPVMIAGALAMSAGFLSVGLCHTWYLMLAAFSLAGVGYFSSCYLPVPVVITSWMGSQKGLGMGLVLGATSVGAAALSPLLSWGIAKYGWRPSLGVISAVSALTLPLILATVRAAPAEPVPTGYRAAEHSAGRRRRKDDLLSSAFVLVTASSVLFNVGMGCILYHLVSVLIGDGYSAYNAGLIYGMTWLLSAVGSLIFGALADRLGARVILAGVLLSCASGIFFLLGAAEARVGMVCVITFTILWGISANGVSQFVPVVFAEQFGADHLGALVGVQAGIAGFASAAAPVVTGALYDTFGDYRPAIYLSAAVTCIAFVLVLMVRPFRRRSSV